MKKNIRRVLVTSIIALTAICVISSIQPSLSKKLAANEIPINESTFPDPNFRNFVLEKIDKDNSLSLSTTEIEETDYLYCASKEISDFTGIEYFTSLKRLSIRNNNLTSFDLSGVQSLTELDCSENPLKKLDMSAYPGLKELTCYDCGLTEINVKSNSSLRRLSCYNNPLTKLDVSSNLDLRELNCSCENLTSLDLSKNTALTTLTCKNTKIKSFDFSNNTELCDLYCENNQLESLDVSNCPRLAFLVCSGNKIKSLDLRNNRNLYKLNCTFNEITTLLLNSPRLDIMDSFGNHVTELNISHCPRFLELMEYVPLRSESYMGAEYEFYHYPGWTQFSFDKGAKLITVEPKPETVTGLSAQPAGRGRVSLSWNAVEGADGYLVYAQKDGEYAYVGMTTRGTTFTDTKALDFDYNYYWVFAYYVNDFGEMICGGCEKYVYAKGVTLAVTDLRASSSTGRVKLNWTASVGADGYLIYGIRPGESYGYIGMTTTGTAFVDRKASTEDWTFYWVFPFHYNGDEMIVGGTAAYVYGKAL